MKGESLLFLAADPRRQRGADALRREAYTCYLEMATRCASPAEWVRYGRRVNPNFVRMSWIGWYISRFDFMIASVEEGLRGEKPHPMLYYYVGVHRAADTILW